MNTDYKKLKEKMGWSDEVLANYIKNSERLNKALKKREMQIKNVNDFYKIVDSKKS